VDRTIFISVVPFLKLRLLSTVCFQLYDVYFRRQQQMVDFRSLSPPLRWAPPTPPEAVAPAVRHWSCMAALQVRQHQKVTRTKVRKNAMK